MGRFGVVRGRQGFRCSGSRRGEQCTDRGQPQRILGRAGNRIGGSLVRGTVTQPPGPPAGVVRNKRAAAPRRNQRKSAGSAAELCKLLPNGLHGTTLPKTTDKTAGSRGLCGKTR